MIIINIEECKNYESNAVSVINIKENQKLKIKKAKINLSI